MTPTCRRSGTTACARRPSPRRQLHQHHHHHHHDDTCRPSPRRQRQQQQQQRRQFTPSRRTSSSPPFSLSSLSATGVNLLVAPQPLCPMHFFIIFHSVVSPVNCLAQKMHSKQLYRLHTSRPRRLRWPRWCCLLVVPLVVLNLTDRSTDIGQ